MDPTLDPFFDEKQLTKSKPEIFFLNYMKTSKLMKMLKIVIFQARIQSHFIFAMAAQARLIFKLP